MSPHIFICGCPILGTGKLNRQNKNKKGKSDFRTIRTDTQSATNVYTAGGDDDCTHLSRIGCLGIRSLRPSQLIMGWTF
jgi:hypothetical protein